MPNNSLLSTRPMESAPPRPITMPMRAIFPPCANETCRIVWLQAKKQRADTASDRDCRCGSQSGAKCEQHDCLPQNHANNIPSTCTKGHSNTDLILAGHYDVRNHTIEPNHGQQ